MSDSPSAPGKKSDTQPPPPNEPRLESWGEIASYLRRDIRTVQRWEKEQGLPVRRLLIGKQGQVYAYRSELDRWMLERQPKAEAEELKDIKPSSPTLARPDEDASDGKRHFRLRMLWRHALAGFLLLAIGSFFIYRFLVPKAESLSTTRAPTRVLLFVRPFANLSPSEKEFVDGLTGEMITRLGRVNPKFLGVFAHTTANELASKSINELKQLLKADFVLEGGVRREKDQIRIDVDLVSTSDQTPTWTNSYTGNLRDVLKFQDEVTNDVAKHLVLALPPLSTASGQSSGGQSSGSADTGSPPTPNITVNPQVYEAYLSGRVYLLDRDFPRSMNAFQQALAIDPEYAPALAGRAISMLLLGETPNDALRPADALPKARQDAYQALQLNPNLSDAYCVLANVAQAFDHDLPEAERLYKKAIELNPNNVTALKWYGDYLFVSKRLAEAVQQINEALEIDPASPLVNIAKAEVKYYQRDFDGAIVQAQHTIDQYPEFSLGRFWLASAYRQKNMLPQALREFGELRQRYRNNSAMLMAYGHTLALSGDRVGAQNVLNELLSQSQSRYVPALYIAGMYTGLGDLDQAFRWLDKAYAEKNDRLVYLGVDPIADPLRSDPRFESLMKKVGLH